MENRRLFPGLLVVFAMMLPTSLPLIALFQTMTRNRSDHKPVVGLLITWGFALWFNAQFTAA